MPRKIIMEAIAANDKYDKPSRLDNYIYKKLTAKKKKTLKAKDGKRTQAVKSGLSAAGLSEAEIKKLQGK
jgi:hypothetical protein